MKKLLVLFLVIGNLLSACSAVAPGENRRALALVNPGTAPTQTSKPGLLSKLEATLILEPVQVDPQDDVRLRKLLGEAMASPDWAVLGLSADRESAWQAYVEQRGDLPQVERVILADFLPEILSSDIAYIILDKIEGDIAGLTYSGAGVVELDRRDLFGNRYQLASVIAHEGSHVLQGPAKSEEHCANTLRREVGDQTIPTGFYDWTGEQLLEAIKAGKIGAYHVSLWVLSSLGLKDLGRLQQVIRTGKVGTSSVVDCNLSNFLVGY